MTPPEVADRITFLRRLHERLAKLSNRLDAATQAKILGAIHARVPMVTADEQRALQRENAEADARFWERMHGMHAGTVDDHKSLADKVAKAVASGEAAAEAKTHADTARDRIARIERGEDVPGGLGKATTAEDFEARLLPAGFTKSDLERMKLYAEVGRLGEEVWEVFSRQHHEELNKLEKRLGTRLARRTLELFSQFEDPVEAAKELLKLPP